MDGDGDACSRTDKERAVDDEEVGIWDFGSTFLCLLISLHYPLALIF